MKKIVLLAAIVAGCSTPPAKKPVQDPYCVSIGDLTWRCSLDGDSYICMRTVTDYGFFCRKEEP